jgi:hypothetical protein
MSSKISYDDLARLVSMAKNNMFNLSFPIFISGSELEKGQLPTLAMLEATITLMNSKGFLKEPVEVEYTSEIEECDLPVLEDIPYKT